VSVTVCIDSAQFQDLILAFYAKEGRDLPWRHTRDPYAIMVSEFMLQQTQTERVLAYYGPWLERFPTLEALSRASLAEALALWSGLGYNRRARFLKQAAEIITGEGAGRFPQDAETLDALPGIGPYTARAITCFAFDRRELFVETNIRTVYLHFFHERLKISLDDAAGTRTGVDDREFIPLINETLPQENPRDFYYALMDYGAMLKKAQVRTNHLSRHYRPQSRFEGSLRQARGAILRCLSREGAGLSLEAIAGAEGIDLERLEGAAAALEKEGLIVWQGPLLRLGA
jgi:A/G-specific adenine glycosylase